MGLSGIEAFLSPNSCRQDSSLHDLPCVPKGRLEQLLMKGEAAKKPLKARLKGSKKLIKTVACQAPLSMGFSRQEYWSGLPCCPPGDLSNPGIEPTSLMSPALAGGFFTTSTPWDKKGLSQICKISLNYLKGASQPQAFSHTFLL